ncbi:Protein FAM161A [Nymphon striatum]|nr:Protein FAM161A [Nymphon striatum]
MYWLLRNAPFFHNDSIDKQSTDIKASHEHSLRKNGNVYSDSTAEEFYGENHSQAENFIRAFTLKVDDETSSCDASVEFESTLQTSDEKLSDDEEEALVTSVNMPRNRAHSCRRTISSDNCYENEEQEIDSLLTNVTEKLNLMNNTNNVGKVRFQATSAPIHCRELRFEAMTEKKKINSAKARQKRIEEVLSFVKPFSFSQVNLKRTNSAPLLQDSDVEYIKDSNMFRAKPVPKFMKDNTAKERMKQEEDFRKLKIKIRSEELLRTSLSPIPIRTKTSYSKSKEKPTNISKLICVKQPPDFRSLHFKLAKDLGNNNSKNMSTVCQPFNLTQSFDFKQNDCDFQIVRSVEKEECKSWRNTSPIPTKMTKATRLRDHSNKQKRENCDKPVPKLEMKKSPSIRRKMAMNCELNSTSPVRFQDKVLELKKFVKERDKDYKMQIKEMKKRVETRPLLVERQAMVGLVYLFVIYLVYSLFQSKYSQELSENAKRSAEKKFNEKLKACGISQSVIEKNCKGYRSELKFNSVTASTGPSDNNNKSTSDEHSMDSFSLDNY